LNEVQFDQFASAAGLTSRDDDSSHFIDAGAGSRRERVQRSFVENIPTPKEIPDDPAAFCTLISDHPLADTRLLDSAPGSC